MILNEMAKQNVKLQAMPAVALKESLGSRNTNGSNFKDIFGGAVGRDTPKNPVTCSQNTKDTRAKQSENRSVSSEENQGAQIRSYRELQRAIRSEVRKNIIQNGKGISDSGEGNGKPEAEETNEVDKDAFNEAVVNCFANLTGLKPEEFKAVLDKAGVTGEELASLTDIEGIAGKIAEATGLTDAQKATLTKLMDLTAYKISSMVQASGDGSEIPSEDEAADQKIRFKVKAKAGDDSGSIQISVKSMTKLDSTNVQAMFRDILAKLKVQLDELKNKLDNGNSSTIEEIDAKLAEMLDSLKGSVKPAAANTAAETDTSNAEDPTAKDQAQKEFENAMIQNARESKSETGDKTAAAEARTAVETKPAAEAPATTDTNTTAVNPLSFAQNQSNEVQSFKDKLDIKAPVQAKEVIHQVIEKAKVVITPDKSEMLMDLKPESLGKLTLKVVTEQGIVMAKFVAENEQVKQILESNMQLLKDSLEKQGMNVQGFNVSVRQDNNSSSSRQYDGGEHKQASLPRGISAVGRTGIAAAAEAAEGLTRNNPYNWGSSTINLTA